MAHAHHPHLLTREWFALHPALWAAWHNYGVPLLMGAVIAAAALFVARLEIELPLHAAVIVDVPSDESRSPPASVPYFGDQFAEQARRAAIQELPPQF